MHTYIHEVLCACVCTFMHTQMQTIMLCCIIFAFERQFKKPKVFIRWILLSILPFWRSFHVSKLKFLCMSCFRCDGVDLFLDFCLFSDYQVVELLYSLYPGFCPCFLGWKSVDQHLCNRNGCRLHRNNPADCEGGNKCFTRSWRNNVR